jgi:hypothetical protein
MAYIGSTPAPQMPEVGTGAVETQDIQDGAVTAAKLAPGAAVPSQTGNSGKYLNTDGSTSSWAPAVASFNTRTGAVTLSSGDVTGALGFTPYNSTNPSGYISSITGSNVTTALGFTPYNATNPNGYISSITSGNVTTALGFTPYNATNPSGYTTNTGTVTNVGGTGTVSGLTLTGSVSTTGNLTLGGTLSLTSGNVTTALGFTPENSANRGTANGYASLDGSGLVPSTQLPSYVDDVLEYANLAGFPATGTTGKIYVAIDTNKTYRWSGSAYVYITSGAVDSVAGKTGVVSLASSDVGLGNVENKSSATIRGEISSANVTTALGFTPYNSSNPSGYISGITSSQVTTALGFTPYNSTNPNGYITGITSSNVTTALGFTPYNSSNPSGYITSSGSISGNATTATTANSATSVLWTGVSSSARNNYELGFQPPNTGFAGFYFSKSTSSPTTADAGYLLIRGTSDNFPVYTAEGITLVSDANSLNLFARGSSLISGGNAWVRMGTGSSETFRLMGDYSYSLNSSRAPIFYDSDNTGYYADSSGTSQFNEFYANNVYANAAQKVWAKYRSQDNAYAASLYWNSLQLGNNGNNYIFAGHNAGNGLLDIYVNATSYSPTVSGTHAARFDSNGAVYNFVSTYSPTYYDYNNSSYYIDANGTSSLNIVNSHALAYQGAVSADNTFGMYFDSARSSAYAIYRASGAWNFPFPDLRIGFHTGIQIGANGSYGGVRFYEDYDMATEVMSVNNSNVGLGAGHVYVNNTLVAGSSVRAPIFYDSNNTAFYVDPASTSNLYQLNVDGTHQGGYGIIKVSSSSDSLISLYTNNGATAGIRLQTATGGLDTLYIGKKGGSDTLFVVDFGFAQTAEEFLVDASGHSYSKTSSQAPIFYDSNNSAYYVDPNSQSNLDTVRINKLIQGKTTTFDWDNTLNGGFFHGYGAGNVARHEIMRIGIDYNDWNYVGSVIIELSENYYASGGYSKWYVSYGYVNSSVVQLMEANGNWQGSSITVGSPVQVSGDHYYLPVYANVQGYYQVSGRVTTTRLLTNANPPAVSYTYILTTPNITNPSLTTAPVPSYGVFNGSYMVDNLYTQVVYDSGNTNFYVDPASTTNLNALTLNGVAVTAGGGGAGAFVAFGTTG